MKSTIKAGPHRFPLSLLHYGNSYYIERIVELEKALAKKPRHLQIDMLGEGEIPADWAMLIRDLLSQRSSKTCVITNARSSLQNGSVLVWLLGDRRLIRGDARLFFRKANAPVEPDNVPAKVWNEEKLKYTEPEFDPDEAGHVRVLQLIDEYLPVKELAGTVIDVRTLRQFGLVDHERLDRFLAEAFSHANPTDGRLAGKPKAKTVRKKCRPHSSAPSQK